MVALILTIIGVLAFLLGLSALILIGITSLANLWFRR